MTCEVQSPAGEVNTDISARPHCASFDMIISSLLAIRLAGRALYLVQSKLSRPWALYQTHGDSLQSMANKFLSRICRVTLSKRQVSRILHQRGGAVL